MTLSWFLPFFVSLILIGFGLAYFLDVMLNMGLFRRIIPTIITFLNLAFGLFYLTHHIFYYPMSQQAIIYFAANVITGSLIGIRLLVDYLKEN